MVPIICFALSFFTFAIFTGLSIRLKIKPTQRLRMLSPLHFLVAGIFISAVLLFLPVYGLYFSGERAVIFKTFVLSIHNTLRLFVLDGEFDIIHSYLSESNEFLRLAYSLYAAFLYVLAPIMTFGVIASFFKNLTAYVSFVLHYFNEIYVFSELNEKSIVLAADIRKKHPKASIIFTDVFDRNDEQGYEIMIEARRIRANCFKYDITAINYNLHSKSAKFSFFILGKDETENINQAILLSKYYGNLKNMHMYVFSESMESELALNTIADSSIHLRRISESRMMLNMMLYENGETLFQNAVPQESGEKLISVVLLGLGKHGRQMFKSLPWLCQMNGYRLELHAFDKDPLAESKMKALLPELMDDAHNGVTTEGEASYFLKVHSGMDVETQEFVDAINALKEISFVFVALGGGGEKNIAAATNMRMLCERRGIKPEIDALVKNSKECSVLNHACNYRGQPYNIHFCGDIHSLYSEKIIIQSQLEQEALMRHMKWGEEADFWKYNYNYSSSIATAIHFKLREKLGMPGSGKLTDELTEEEKTALEELEHKRWNAYVRSEGYIYSGSRDKGSRNDLAKMHHDLVPFAQLSESDKRKDSNVGTR